MNDLGKVLQQATALGALARTRSANHEYHRSVVFRKGRLRTRPHFHLQFANQLSCTRGLAVYCATERVMLYFVHSEDAQGSGGGVLEERLGCGKESPGKHCFQLSRGLRQNEQQHWRRLAGKPAASLRYL